MSIKSTAGHSNTLRTHLLKQNKNDANALFCCHWKVPTCEEILRSPDFEKDSLLQMEASDVGVGAVLSQCDEDCADHPVAYYSRKLLAREQKYSTIEKECLAIKLATQAFWVYLLGRPFIIQTNHRALEWMDWLRENNAKLSRWSIALQPFKFQVRYWPGKDNGNTDCLSRLSTEWLLQKRRNVNRIVGGGPKGVSNINSAYFIYIMLKIGGGGEPRPPRPPPPVPTLMFCRGEGGRNMADWTVNYKCVFML